MSFLSPWVLAGTAGAAVARRSGGVLLRLALRRREWVALFEAREIRVITRGLLRARLLVDGRCRDRRSPMVVTDRRIPLLGTLLSEHDPVPRVVEVYANGPLAARIAVRVGGVPIRAVRDDRRR